MKHPFPILLLALLLPVGWSSGQESDPSGPDFRFRVIGFGVEATELYFVEEDEVRSLSLRDRLISEGYDYGGPMPLRLFAAPPPVDDPDAPWPPAIHALDGTVDGDPRLVAFFPAAGGDEGYRTVMLRDERDAAEDGGTIRLYNFTRLDLGVKLGESTDRVGPLSLIEWDNEGGQRRAFVVLVAEDSEEGRLRPLRSGYLRLSSAARSLVFVLPGNESEGGPMNPRLVQIYDYL
jgi:hypothetical protein